MNLIFDFDGTLVDSFDCALEKLNLLADEFHYKKVAAHEITRLKNLSSHDFVKHLQIPFYKIPRVLLKARQLVRDEVPFLPSFVTLPEVLQQLHEQHITMGILTSNASENVQAWLKRHGLAHLFAFVHNESNYFGKARLLNTIVKQNKFAKEDTFYIGDETRDIEAAKKCGIVSVAVTWGFNAEDILQKHTPHFLLKEPKDIFRIVNPNPL